MSGPERHQEDLELRHARIEELPAGAGERQRHLGVDYVYRTTADGGDLYLTRFGLPFREHLQPENWHAPEWFASHRQRLLGTSSICRMPTRPIGGLSLDLVVRHSRVGEPVPLDTDVLHRHLNAEFNTPFEEFSLVFELRQGSYGPASLHIGTKHPLGIYSPPDRLAPWQTGRSADKLAVKHARQPGVPLEPDRAYLLLYGWIEGQDAEQIADDFRMQGEERTGFLQAVNDRAVRELALKGFEVADIKPAHIILRRNREGRLLRRHDHRLAYAIVDYELLARTPEHAQWLAGR
ncbi:MAG: hypothetical protein H7A45_09345 [Verrucomicrobiales bacterium]|nr:hypothetical protein [Verrucomicrobiales bacterium]MCP5526213.1 hypothetical protein [Verrucomicrobiales bacterium]